MFIGPIINALLRPISWRLVRQDGSWDHGLIAQQSLVSKTEESPVIIFDVGANNGSTALRYQKIFPDAQIYAFEPHPLVYRELVRVSNKNSGILPEQFAMGDRIQSGILHTRGKTDTSSLLCYANEVGGGEDTPVSVSTIDAFCSQRDIQRIHILKMDIQGGELTALRGAERMLRQHCIDALYIEVLFESLYTGQAWGSEIIEFLRTRGYRLVDLYDRRYSSKGFLRWADALFSREGV